MTRPLYLLPLAAVLAIGALAPAPARAQIPLGVGTATGLGLGGMTEARLAEAALWNPALGAVPDGPARSLSLLGVVLEPGVWGSATGAWNVLGAWRADAGGPLSDGRRAELLGLRSRDGALSAGSRAAVQWFGLQAKDLRLSLTTYGLAELRMPARAAGLAAGDSTMAWSTPTADEELDAARRKSRYHAASVLALSRAADLGSYPLVGRVWVGATAKGTLVHHYSEGRFAYGDETALGVDTLGHPLVPGAQLTAGRTAARYAGYGVKGVALYGADIGVVALPMRSVMVSAAISNVVQGGAFGKRAKPAFTETIVLAGVDSASRQVGIARTQALDLGADDRPWLAEAQAAAAAAVFLPVARAGLAIETRGGRLVLGFAEPLSSDPALDRDTHDRWSIGYVGTTAPARPRVAVTERRDGTRVYSVGVLRAGCGRLLGLGASLLSPPDDAGRSVQVSLSWTGATAVCGRRR